MSHHKTSTSRDCVDAIHVKAASCHFLEAFSSIPACCPTRPRLSSALHRFFSQHLDGTSSTACTA
jgi:hypothetical protein